MHSYGMGESDRGFCNTCNHLLEHCVCMKLRVCNNCQFTMTDTAEQYAKHSCVEVKLDAERTAHQETQAKLDASRSEINGILEAGAKAGFVFSISKSGWIVEHEPNMALDLALTNAADAETQLAETQAIARELQADKERLDWIFLNGHGFAAMPVWGGPGRSYREVIDKEIAKVKAVLDKI